MPKLFLKLAVSIIVFAIVLSRINIGAVCQAIGGADILFLTLALFLALAMVVTDAAFWQSVLGSLGHRISFGTALLYCIVGSFFGGFGLSWTGVDIFRAAQLRRSGISTEPAIRAVVTTRLMSLTSLLAVIACGLPIVLGYPLQLHDKVLLVSFVVIGVGGMVAIVILGSVHNRFPRLQLPAFLDKTAGVSIDFLKALSSKRHSPASLLFSTSTHLLRVSTFAAIAASLHAGVNFAALYALVPISLLVAMVPIALGSWGVREASVIFFLGRVGVPAAMALSISVTYGILALIVGAIGGPVWVFARSHHYELTVKDTSDSGTQASTGRGTLAGPRLKS
jgi:uncharacterized membrane protein YbhN (UPF0104 family)